MSIFQSADILLPHNANMEKWAVIACDQFSAQPEYWQTVRQNAENAPSTVNLILPECDLEGDYSGKVAKMLKARFSVERYSLLLQPILPVS